MIDLSQTYRELGRAWTEDELGVRYAAANRRGEQLVSETMHTAPDRPIALLATAIPSAATLSVAIHLAHALPEGARAKLAAELLDTAETDAADALHRCHRALELDGLAHGYTADEWLPVIYDGAAPLLESSRLDQEPPSLVRQTRHTVRWLSSSIASLDEDSREAPRPSPTRLLACSSCACSPMQPARAWSSGPAPGAFYAAPRRVPPVPGRLVAPACGDKRVRELQTAGSCCADRASVVASAAVARRSRPSVRIVRAQRGSRRTPHLRRRAPDARWPAATPGIGK